MPQLIVEFWDKAGSDESSLHLAVTGESLLPELEDVLQSNHLSLHSGDFGDVGNLSGAVGIAGLLNHNLNCRGDLFTDRANRQIHSSHQNHRLESSQRIPRRIGVECGQGSIVPGIHRLQHVERFPGAALSDDDPVWPHPQAVLHQVANGDGTFSFQIRRARFQLNPMFDPVPPEITTFLRWRTHSSRNLAICDVRVA